MPAIEFFFFSSRRRHTRSLCDWSSDVCSSDLLWKKADAEDEAVGAAWDAPFGRGRPGWHLECSAMSLSEIARCCGVQTLDIHAGGIDLIFPHHENEIGRASCRERVSNWGVAVG